MLQRIVSLQDTGGETHQQQEVSFRTSSLQWGSPNKRTIPGWQEGSFCPTVKIAKKTKQTNTLGFLSTVGNQVTMETQLPGLVASLEFAFVVYKYNQLRISTRLNREAFHNESHLLSDPSVWLLQSRGCILCPPCNSRATPQCCSRFKHNPNLALFLCLFLPALLASQSPTSVHEDLRVRVKSVASTGVGHEGCKRGTGKNHP